MAPGSGRCSSPDPAECRSLPGTADPGGWAHQESRTFDPRRGWAGRAGATGRGRRWARRGRAARRAAGDVEVIIQGHPSGQLKHPVDLVKIALAAAGPPPQLPTAQAGWRNIPNPSQWEA